MILKLTFAFTHASNCFPWKVNIFFTFWIYCWIFRENILLLIIILHKPTYDAKIDFLFFIVVSRTLLIFICTPIISFEVSTLQIIFNVNSLLLLAQKMNLSLIIILIQIIILFFILFLAFSIELHIIDLNRK